MLVVALYKLKAHVSPVVSTRISSVELEQDKRLRCREDATDLKNVTLRGLEEICSLLFMQVLSDAGESGQAVKIPLG